MTPSPSPHSLTHLHYLDVLAPVLLTGDVRLHADEAVWSGPVNVTCHNCHVIRDSESPEAVGVAAAGGDGPHLLLALRQLPPPALLLLLLVLARENRDKGVAAHNI